MLNPAIGRPMEGLTPDEFRHWNDQFCVVPDRERATSFVIDERDNRRYSFTRFSQEFGAAALQWLACHDKRTFDSEAHYRACRRRKSFANPILSRSQR